MLTIYLDDDTELKPLSSVEKQVKRGFETLLKRSQSTNL